jgi:hypothetical protein
VRCLGLSAQRLEAGAGKLICIVVCSNSRQT